MPRLLSIFVLAPVLLLLDCRVLAQLTVTPATMDFTVNGVGAGTYAVTSQPFTVTTQTAGQIGNNSDTPQVIVVEWENTSTTPSTWDGQGAAWPTNAKVGQSYRFRLRMQWMPPPTNPSAGAIQPWHLELGILNQSFRITGNVTYQPPPSPNPNPNPNPGRGKGNGPVVPWGGQRPSRTTTLAININHKNRKLTIGRATLGSGGKVAKVDLSGDSVSLARKKIRMGTQLTLGYSPVQLSSIKPAVDVLGPKYTQPNIPGLMNPDVEYQNRYSSNLTLSTTVGAGGRAKVRNVYRRANKGIR